MISSSGNHESIVSATIYSHAIQEMNYNSPIEIREYFRKSAAQKVNISVVRQVVLGLLGGAFISFGGLLAVMVAGGMSEIASGNPGVVKLLFGSLFPVGLIMIVIGGGQLFTSDCAVLPYGWLRHEISFAQWMKSWSVVLLSNLAGALIVAYFFTFEAGLLSHNPWKEFISHLALTKTSAPFSVIFIKAVGANWLVCLAVWMSYAAKDVTGKVIAVWIPVMTFVVMGLEHSVANLFFIPAAMFNGADITVSAMISNIIPATLGNIVGGVLGIALPYWFVFDYKRAKRTASVAEPLKKFEPNLN